MADPSNFRRPVDRKAKSRMQRLSDQRMRARRALSPQMRDLRDNDWTREITRSNPDPGGVIDTPPR